MKKGYSNTKNTKLYAGISFMMLVYGFMKMLFDKYVPYIFEITFIILIVFGTFLFFHKRRIKKSEGAIWLLWILLLLYFFLNGWYAGNKSRFIRGLYEYDFYLLFFPAGIFWATYFVPCIERYIEKINYLGAMLSALSVLEFIQKQSILSGMFTGTIIGGDKVFRSTVFARSYLVFGIQMAVFSMFAFYLFLKSKNIRYLIFTLIDFVGILTTSSRGPLMASLICMVFMYLWLAENRQMTMRAIKLMIAIGLIMSALYIVGVYTNNSTILYFVSRIDTVFDWQHDAGNVGRLSRWSRTLTMWKSSPVFGIGVSSTGSWDLSQIVITTESGMLKRLVETGIVGFVLYYGYLTKIALYIIKRIRFCDTIYKQICKVTLCLASAIFLEDVILQVTEEIVVSYLFWFFIAIAYACVRDAQDTMQFQKPRQAPKMQA